MATYECLRATITRESVTTNDCIDSSKIQSHFQLIFGLNSLKMSQKARLMMEIQCLCMEILEDETPNLCVDDLARSSVEQLVKGTPLDSREVMSGVFNVLGIR